MRHPGERYFYSGNLYARSLWCPYTASKVNVGVTVGSALCFLSITRILQRHGDTLYYFDGAGHLSDTTNRGARLPYIPSILFPPLVALYDDVFSPFENATSHFARLRRSITRTTKTRPRGAGWKIVTDYLREIFAVLLQPSYVPPSSPSPPLGRLQYLHVWLEIYSPRALDAF